MGVTFPAGSVATCLPRIIYRGARVACPSHYNGVTTLVLPTFLRVNASSVPLFHGSASWHYYLTQAVPLLTGPALPFDGAYLAAMHGRDILSCCFITAVWTSTVLSCAGHKGLRFLYSFIGQICHGLGLHPPDQVDPYVSMISSRNLLGNPSTSSMECDCPGHHGTN
jgi:hypothetical protein